MLHQDVENIDLEHAKWRVRHVGGLLRHHRTKRRRLNFAAHVERVELVDWLGHAHVNLEKELRKQRQSASTIPLPAL